MHLVANNESFVTSIEFKMCLVTPKTAALLQLKFNKNTKYFARPYDKMCLVAPKKVAFL